MSEWKKVKLGEISQTIQTGPFGSQLHQSDYSVIGIPVVMPKDIIAGNRRNRQTLWGECTEANPKTCC